MAFLFQTTTLRTCRSLHHRMNRIHHTNMNIRPLWATVEKTQQQQQQEIASTTIHASSRSTRPLKLVFPLLLQQQQLQLQQQQQQQQGGGPNRRSNILFRPDEYCPPRMRFAPSPTGSLHVGGARTALYNWLVAQKGKQLQQQQQQQITSKKEAATVAAGVAPAAFVVRVEDTDLARSTQESEDSVLTDLRWLGLHWDEGPITTNDNLSTSSQQQDNKNHGGGGPYGPYRQSERSDLYTLAAHALLEQGHAYRCFCTNEEIEAMKAEQAARGETTLRYDGRWRDASEEAVQAMLNSHTPFTIRFKVPNHEPRIVIDDVVRGTVAWDAQATVGDFILLRSSGVPVYNFCVAVDDATMGITTVVRAEEHLTNTLRQVLILDALHAPRPRYAHCSLILGQDKQKLSKRHGATSCDQYRQDGFLPDAMINYLALLGWNDGTDNEIFTREELIDAFDLHRVVKSPSVFDLEKLKWVNAQHLKMRTIEELVPYVMEQVQRTNMLVEQEEENPLVDYSSSSSNNNNNNNKYDKDLRDFCYAATALAKQMMETTKDAALNAQRVLQYGLPPTFDRLTASPGAEAEAEYQAARIMIEQGHFYSIATKIVQQYQAGIFPQQPDAHNLLAAFTDSTGRAIEEDSQQGAACSFTQQYLAHMKSLAQELGYKGKNLFHPIRLAITGEMSGQDVTKQLSLLALACKEEGSVIDKVGVVSFPERMERLQSFCASIPEEFRQPRTATVDSSSIQKSPSASSTSSTMTMAASVTSGADPKDSYQGPAISALDIRVGMIQKVWEHPEAEKLYCEEIDVGESTPRHIASGLRPYLQPDDLLGRKVLVLCNLKERKLVGFPSHGMILCASNADHSQVRLVSPPVDARIGERVIVPDFDFGSFSEAGGGGGEGQPFAENKMAKKKVFEAIAPYLRTNQYGLPVFLGRPFMTSAGVCTSPISDGSVS